MPAHLLKEKTYLFFKNRLTLSLLPCHIKSTLFYLITVFSYCENQAHIHRLRKHFSHVIRKDSYYA